MATGYRPVVVGAEAANSRPVDLLLTVMFESCGPNTPQQAIVCHAERIHQQPSCVLTAGLLFARDRTAISLVNNASEQSDRCIKLVDQVHQLTGVLYAAEGLTCLPFQ